MCGAYFYCPPAHLCDVILQAELYLYTSHDSSDTEVAIYILDCWVRFLIMARKVCS
jgi:hypothetical protein